MHVLIELMLDKNDKPLCMVSLLGTWNIKVITPDVNRNKTEKFFLILSSGFCLFVCWNEKKRQCILVLCKRKLIHM